MTVSKTRIFSQAATILGEVPVSAVSALNDDTETIYEAAWPQFIPQFIQDTRLIDFTLEADLSEIVVGTTTDADSETITAITAPEELETVFAAPSAMLEPLELEFAEAAYGMESYRWRWVPVNYVANATNKVERWICTNGGSTPRLRYLYLPTDPVSADSEWGDGVSKITERAIAASFAEYLSPARANDEATIRNVAQTAYQARLKAKQHSGQIGSRRYRQTTSLITERFSRSRRFRYPYFR